VLVAAKHRLDVCHTQESSPHSSLRRDPAISFRERVWAPLNREQWLPLEPKWVVMDTSNVITVRYLLTDTSCKPIIMVSPTKEKRFDCTVSAPENYTSIIREQGWYSGESARLPLMWPGFNSGPVSHLGWVCCWFSPCSESFSLCSTVFLLPQSLHQKFQSDHDRGPSCKPAKTDVASSLNIVIYYLIYLQYLISG